MLRCPESAGRYRVTAAYLMGNDGTPNDEEMFLDMGPHADVRLDDGRLVEHPYVSTKDGYEGELCQHEVAFMSRMPGKVYSARRRYRLEPLDGQRGKQG